MKAKEKKCTLRDIAREAGVSKGTISNYLNNPDRIRPANRVRIEKAIKTFEFMPNINARILATGVSRNIVLYVLCERLISPTTWLHQLPVIQTICDELTALDYNMQMRIEYADDLDSTFKHIFSCVEGKAADGILLVSVWEVSEKITSYLRGKQFPFVIVGSFVDDPEVCSVYFDNYEVMSRLVDILAEKGHRNIGYMGVRSGQQDMKCRFRGYVDGMLRHGLDIMQDHILYGDFSVASGRACILDALDRSWGCTAVLCGNDNMAVGALKALQERGLRVPQDVSVVGIDNSIAAEAASIRLNTVQFDLEHLGSTAVEKLMKQLAGEKIEEYHLKVGYQIISGESIDVIGEQFEAQR